MQAGVNDALAYEGGGESELDRDDMWKVKRRGVSQVYFQASYFQFIFVSVFVDYRLSGLSWQSE